MKTKKNCLNKINILIIIIIIFIVFNNNFRSYYIKNKDDRKITLYNENYFNFREIVSFEKNLSLNQNIFIEFININSNNKLIEGNTKFHKSYNPDITVIITIYNQADSLHKCLRSVQNQSLKNIEIIIIDDCSLDNSTEIIMQYQKEDERIILISHNMNEGVIKSRTDGIRKARGKYITIVDGDDALIHKDILKNSLYIAQKAGLDVVEFHIARFVNQRFKDIYNYSMINISHIIYQPEIRTKFFFKMNKYYYIQNRIVCSKLIKKELFLEVLSFIGDEFLNDYINYAEDTLMIISVFHLAKSYYIMKEFGYYYSFKKKKSITQIAKKICKTNNKLKSIGWYKYLKFLVDKKANNEMEKIITYNEFRFLNKVYFLPMKLDNREYKLMLYVLNKILQFDTLNKNQKEYIIELKNKALKKLKNGKY